MKDKFCKLFVGRLRFVVNKETLLKNDQSYFGELLAGNSYDRKNDVIYIDRDGTHFNAILNHLRGCLKLDNWTTRDLQELAIEADYYFLTDLEEQINSVIEKRQLAQNKTPETRFNSHLMNLDYNELVARLKSNNRKTFVIFVRSDQASEFEPFLAMLEQECMHKCGGIELTFIYDVYPHQKIQIFLPEKGLLFNCWMLLCLEPLESIVEHIAENLHTAYLHWK